MALDMEATNEANVSQGLLSLGHGLDTFLASKYTLCPVRQLLRQLCTTRKMLIK